MTNWVERLKKQLRIDEGVVYGIYKDSLGKLTFGVGHLLTKKDPEFKLLENCRWDYKKIDISPERVESVFEHDLQKHILETKSVFSNFDSFEDEIKEILVNMVFNLGVSRFRGFKNFIEAIKNKKYLTAADEMIDSRWFDQVGDRSHRLASRMIKLGIEKTNLKFA